MKVSKYWAREAATTEESEGQEYHLISSRPPDAYPHEDTDQQRRFASWLSGYDRKAQDYAVCRLADELGDADPPPAVRSALQLHDKYVLNPSSQALA